MKVTPALVPATLKSILPRASSIPLRGWEWMAERGGEGKEGKCENCILRHTNKAINPNYDQPLVVFAVGLEGMSQRLCIQNRQGVDYVCRDASHPFRWGRNVGTHTHTHSCSMLHKQITLHSPVSVPGWQWGGCNRLCTSFFTHLSH